MSQLSTPVDSSRAPRCSSPADLAPPTFTPMSHSLNHSRASYENWNQSLNATQPTTPEGCSRAALESAMQQVLSVVSTQTRDVEEKRSMLAAKDVEAEQLKQLIDRLESQVSQLTAEAEASHSEAAETALALQKLKTDSSARVETAQARIADQRTSHAAAVRDLEATQAERLANERAQNENDFQELRKGFEEDLESHRTAMEESAATQVQEVEEVWSKRYGEVKSKLEKAVVEMKTMRTKAQELRKMELEALDNSGKTLAQQMEDAMKLIRQAQDHSVSERLRYSSAALFDDVDGWNGVNEKDVSGIPSPSQIKAQYTGRISVPRGGV